MKKFSTLFALLIAAIAGFSQVLPADYDNDALNRALNDSVNNYYTVTSHQLKSVAGVEVIDSSLLTLNRYDWPTNGLYKPSFTANNELQIVFNRAKGDTLNYSEFNLLWAGWGVNEMRTLPRKGLSPFPYSVSGTAANPIITTVSNQDTLFGYAVNMHDNPEVRMTVRCSRPTNIRVDLIDKNQRWANVLAPHHRITSINKDTTLVFRWDYRPLNANNVADWTFEIPGMNDFDIGAAADGFSSDWWGVENGRLVQNGLAPLPILGGRLSWSGALVLDSKNIVGMAVTLEDGSITTWDGKDFGYGMSDSKTLTIKKMYVGSSTSFVDLTGKLTKMPKIVHDTISKIVSVSPNKLMQGANKSFTVVGKGKPFVNDVFKVILISPKTKKYLSVSNFIRTNDSICSFDVSATTSSSVGEYDLSIIDYQNNVFVYKSAVLVEPIPLTNAQFVSISPNSLKQNEYLPFELTIANVDFLTNIPVSVCLTSHDDATCIYYVRDIFISGNTLKYSTYFPRASIVGKYDISVVYCTKGQYDTIRLASSVIDVKSIPPLQLDSVVPAQTYRGARFYASVLLSDITFSNPQFQLINSINGSVIDLYSDGMLYERAFVIRNDIGNAQAGYYDLSVVERNSDGTSKYVLLKKAVLISEPEGLPITSFSPNSCTQGEIVRCTITAANHDFSQGDINALFALNNDLHVVFDIKYRSKDTVIGNLYASDTKPGIYDVIFSHYVNPDFNNFTGKSIFTIKEAPALQLQSLSINTVQQWRDTTVVLYVKNAKFTTADYFSVSFNKGDTLIPTQTKVINDSCVELHISLTTVAGMYDLSVYLNNNNLIRKLNVPAVLQVTKGRPTEVFPDSLVVLSQGKGKHVSIVVPNANFGSNYFLLIDSCSLVFPPATVLNDSTLSVYIFAKDTAVGTYDFSFVFTQNGAKRKVFAKNAVKIEKIIPPVFKRFSQSSVLINSWANIGIVYTNGIFWTTYPSDVVIIKDSKPVDTVSSQVWNDDSLSIQFPSNLPEGTYDLRIISQTNKLIKDYFIPSAIRVYDPSNPHIVSVLPASKPQYVGSQIRIKVANANFSQNLPSRVDFKGQTSSFYSSVISALDDETVLVSLISSNNVLPGVYTVSLSVSDGTTYKTITATNAFTITPSSVAPSILELFPSSAKQDTMLTVLIKGSNCRFIDAEVYHLLLMYGNGLSIIVSDLISKINDSVLQCSLTIPSTIAVGSYQLKLSESGKLNESFVYPVLDAAFTVLPNANSPRIEKLESGSARQGELRTLYLSANNVDFVKNNPTLVLLTQSPNSVSASSSEIQVTTSNVKVLNSHLLELTVQLPRLANIGYYDVIVNYDSKSMYLPKGFVVTPNPDAPRLVSISQTEAVQGTTLTATVTGQNLDLLSPKGYSAAIAKSRVTVCVESVSVLTENTFSILCRIPESTPEGEYDLLFTIESQNSFPDYFREFLTLSDAVKIVKNSKAGNESTNLTSDLVPTIEAYPNPTTGQIIVSLPTNAKVEIINSLGQIVLSQADIAAGKAQFDISALSNGIYKLMVHSDTRVLYINILKK